MATSKKVIDSNSTEKDVLKAVHRSTGTVQEVTDIIAKFRGWTDEMNDVREKLRDYVEDFSNDVGGLHENFKKISEEDLSKILDVSSRIHDEYFGISREAEGIEGIFKSLSKKLSDIMYDAVGESGMTRSWEQNVRRTSDLVNQMWSSEISGEALSNKRLAREASKATQIQLLDKEITEAIESNSDSAYQKAVAILESKEKGLEVSKKELREAKRLVDMYNTQAEKLKALNNLVRYREISEKTARGLDRRAGVGAVNALSKVANSIGFSGISDILQDRIDDFQKSARIAQSQEFKELLKRKGITQRANGNYYRKGEVEPISSAGIKELMAEASLNVPVLELIQKLWKGIGAEIAATVFSLGTLLKLWSSFKEVNQEAVALKQSIGSWGYSSAAANQSLATSVDWLKTAASLSEQLKMNPITVFSTDEIGRISEAKTLLGLTDQQAASLGVRAKLISGSIKEYKSDLIEGVNSGIRMTGAAVSHGAALKEALNASTAIGVSMGNNAVRMGEAAQAALAMGMSLKDIEAISQNLLNFESSISAEMTAQLMTGRQLNLSKAREYALNNDLQGVAKELQNTGMSMVEYGNLNVFQQESYAKALGMSREQMAQMLVLQYLRNEVSADEVKKATKMTDEQLEAMTTATRWKMAVDKLMQSFAPILDIVANIADAMSGVVSSVAKVTGSITGFITKFNETSGGKVFKFVGTGIVHFTLLALAVKNVGKVVAKTFAGIRGIAGIFKKGGLIGGIFGGDISSRINNVTRVRGTGRNLPTLAKNIRKFFTILSSSKGAAAGFTKTMVAAVGGILAMSVAVAAVAALFLGMGQFFKGLGSMLSQITMERVKCLPLLGVGLLSVAAGMQAMGIAGLMVVPALLSLGVLRKVAKDLEKMSKAIRSIPTSISLPRVQGISTEDTNSIEELTASLDKLSKIRIDRIEKVSTTIRNLGISIATLSNSLMQMKSLDEGEELDVSKTINKGVEVGEQVAVTSRYVEKAYSGIYKNEVRNTENTLNATVQEIRKIEEHIYGVVQNIDKRMDGGVRMTWDALEFSRKLAETPEIA